MPFCFTCSAEIKLEPASELSAVQRMLILGHIKLNFILARSGLYIYIFCTALFTIS